MKAKLFAAVAALAMVPFGASAQVATAKVHGHVTNPAGFAMNTGDVKFTKDKTSAEKDQKMLYSFPIDKNGDYKATGLAAGDYFVYVVGEEKHIDRLEVTLKDGDDKTLDFDMTREEYIKTMTPEQKAQLAEYKKHASAALDANKVIAGLNATLKQVREDLSAAAKNGNSDVDADVSKMKDAVGAKPDEALLWVTYGDTLQAQGDHLARVDREAKKSPLSDDATMAEFAAAADAYKKGIDASVASKKPVIGDQATAYNQLGNTLAKSGKAGDAAAAFENAAKLQPTSAGMFYNNEAAVLFNNGKGDEALAAAEKAIAADPNRADPYFIKGQALVQHATVDPKTQLPVAPPGCLEAYRKYLELAPEGSQAATVKDILTGFGQKIDTKYNAGPKKK